MNWRIIPKVSYTNFRKRHPHTSTKCFKSILSFTRMWSGRIIYINVRHHSLCLDFRKKWVSDMMK